MVVVRSRALTMFLVCGLCACYSMSALSQQSAAQESQTVSHSTLTRKTLETESVVKRGILSAIQGKEEDCQSEHQFVLHALRDQQITSRDCSYRITGWTGEVNALRISDSTPMAIDLYYIDSIEWDKNKSVASFKRKLRDEKGCVKGLLSFEEPLVCYYFLRASQLVLLVQHGMSSVFDRFDMNAVIEGIKKEN
jgi:hypothetical protein